MPYIAYLLQLLKDVALGCLLLGQPSPTLSGGEAQRIKLDRALQGARRHRQAWQQRAAHALSTRRADAGLQMADQERLIWVLHRLVDGRHLIVVIEHGLDVIAEADWVIDLGPEGGVVSGGRVVAEAVPERVIALAESHTGAALRPA